MMHTPIDPPHTHIHTQTWQLKKHLGASLPHFSPSSIRWFVPSKLSGGMVGVEIDQRLMMLTHTRSFYRVARVAIECIQCRA